MTADGLLARAPGVLWRNTMRGVLISVADDTDPLMCTPPGDVVWELLAEPATRDELTTQLAEIFDADPAIIAADLAPVLDTLLAAGALIETQTHGG